MSLEEREVHRYYQPWLQAHGSSLNVANNVESIAESHLKGTGYTPRASRDKALTAFAQLIALRLNTKRCMVSLIDSANQYILAEATRTNTLSGAESNTGAGDDLWLGSTILKRKDAVCEHCMYNVCTGLEDDGRPYAAKGLIINDCRLDPRFSERSYVKQEDGVRFYAGVPLFSRHNYMIGALATSDDIPREGLRASEIKLLQETATSVMEHLGWARDRVDRFKGERIVRGMATFIERCSSFDDDSAEPESARSPKEDRPQHLLPRPRLTSRKSARRAVTSNATKKADGMSHMFTRAADILREATLADGCAIFGASPGSGRNESIKAAFAGGALRTPQPSPASDSEKHDTNTSDSDSSPGARPCKILAYALADEQARADIESGTALSIGTLDKYFSLFPQGRTFSFTAEGAGVSSEDDSASDREPLRDRASSTAGDGKSKPRSRKRRMDHKELLKKIPGAKNVIFLPLFDHGEERLIAGCFLWTSVTGRMMLDTDLSFLRAFSNCIVSEVVRMNMQKNEASKTTFIASMSHELRSPLHGILGAAEFLMDTMTDAYQSGLITSILTCGKTLLDTLNHVLDYSKINKLGRAQMRKHAKQNKLINLASDSSLESLNMTAEVDLGILVEEVAEAVTAGHSFKRLPGAGQPNSFDALTSGIKNKKTAKSDVDHQAAHPLVLLDISPRRSWLVRVQPGALRRIIMNLLGNALKYTAAGFVALSLRAEESESSSRIETLIRVVDSGKGMSESFQKDRLFLPFSQEDSFQPGTGLGLSIVKSIVDSLGGSIEVKSQQSVGTEIDVRLSLTPAGQAEDRTLDPDIVDTEAKTRGKHLVILDVPRDGLAKRPPTDPVARLERTIFEACTRWLGMRVTQSYDMDVSQKADFFLFCEPPPMGKLLKSTQSAPDSGQGSRGEVPVVIVCMNDEEAIGICRKHQHTLRELGRVVEVIPQPCGPRKLAKVLDHCLKRVQDLATSDDTDTTEPSGLPLATPDWAPEKAQSNANKELSSTMSAAISYPTPPPINPTTPSLQSRATSSDLVPTIPDPVPPRLHILLVDDNKINRQLLVMFMKKCSFSYKEAENGLEAVELYKASCNIYDPRRFDFVLMDISMPVMDGMEATRKIREFETENGIPKTCVIALTGLASAQAQSDAETAGIDVFLPKPVKFAELRLLLSASKK